jgi:hypothetical protein
VGSTVRNATGRMLLRKQRLALRVVQD